MYFIITYDITAPKRLVKILKLMRQYLFWVQKSVFEGELTEKKYIELKKKVKSIINKEEDSVIFYRIRNIKVIERETAGVVKNENIYFF